MRVCSKCKESKDLSQFYPDKSKKSGVTSRCTSCQKEGTATRYRENIEEMSLYFKRHYQKNRPADRQTFPEFISRLKANAKGRKVAATKYAHKRRLQLEQQTMSEFDEFAFEEAIALAGLRSTLTPFKWHVDHIVPINHRKACGLHVAANFQVVPAYWNVRKSNTSMAEYDFT